MRHELKIWHEPFLAVVGGEKGYEVRRNDRDYKVGDVLRLKEWDNAKSVFTGHACTVRVVHMTAGGGLGSAARALRVGHPENRMTQPNVMYVITQGTKDFGDLYAVREWVFLKGKAVPGRLITTAVTIEIARVAVPPHFLRMERSPSDDPVVVESWI